MEDRQFAGDLLRAAKGVGAKACEVVVTSAKSVQWQGMKAGQPQSSRHVAVRLYLDGGRMGVASGLLRGPASSPRIIEKALGRAQSAEPSASEGPPRRLDVSDRGLSIEDPRMAHLDDETRTEAIDWQEHAVAAAPGLVGRFVYDERHQSRVYASSRGLDAVERSTAFSLRGTVEAVGDPARGATELVTSRNFSDVASRPIGADLVARVNAQIDPVSLPSGPVPMLLAPRVVARILEAVTEGFRAERVEAGSSFLRGMAGKPIGSDRLHIVDDAALPGGVGTRAFDDRGIPPVSVNLVREGLLGGLYQGVSSAREVDARPSGHERLDSKLWAGNLIVRAGNRSRNMIVPLYPAVVLVEDLMEDPIFQLSSGNLTLKLSVFHMDASGVGPWCGVHELRVGLLDLFGGVSHVLSDHERHGSVDTATWIVEGVWFD